MPRPTITPIGLTLGLTIVVSACSVSFGSTGPRETAEQAIEDELAEVLGLELSDASCAEPSAEEPDVTFPCSATTDSGEAVTVEAIIEPDEKVFVAANNVVRAEDMAAIEAEAIETLAPEVDLPPERLAVDCPNEPVVLDDGLLVCEISDTSTGERFELLAEIGDYVLRDGFTSRRYAVGAEIE